MCQVIVNRDLGWKRNEINGLEGANPPKKNKQGCISSPSMLGDTSVVQTGAEEAAKFKPQLKRGVSLAPLLSFVPKKGSSVRHRCRTDQSCLLKQAHRPAPKTLFVPEENINTN